MDTIHIRNVCFQKITEDSFKKINLSDLQFFIVSQSGVIDTPGNIYLFTSNNAFFMDKNGYNNGFIDNFLSKFLDWNLINLYFCDFLIIKPEIYNSLVKKLCARNIRDFWFETSIDLSESL